MPLTVTKTSATDPATATSSGPDPSASSRPSGPRPRARGDLGSEPVERLEAEVIDLSARLADEFGVSSMQGPHRHDHRARRTIGHCGPDLSGGRDTSHGHGDSADGGDDRTASRSAAAVISINPAASARSAVNRASAR